MHFGDTHLGRKQPSKISKERVESSIKSLEYCVEKAVEEDVDFIVHAGDMFDTVYPWHSVIDAAKKKLRPLEKNEIPMYVIRGNHDRSYGQGRSLKGLATEHLENDFIHLIDPSPGEFPEKAFIDIDEDLRVYGLGYHASKTPQILRDFQPEKNNSILLLHDFVDGVTRSFSDGDVRADQLAEKDLDYVAIGHDHQPNPWKEINDTVFSATGGTIDYDFNTTEFGKNYNIVEISDEGLERIETGDVPQQLELKRLKVPLEKASFQDLKEKVEELKTDADLAVKISVEGEIDETDPSSIPTHELGEKLEALEGVVMAEVLLDLSVEGYEKQEVESEKFSVEEYMSQNLEDEEVSENIQRLHRETNSMLADDQNLTSSGFNLNKESRENLKKEVKEALFDET